MVGKSSDIKTAPQDVQSILLNGKYATQQEIDDALAYAKQNDKPFTDFLIQEGVLTPDLLGQAVAESFGVPYSDLNSASIAPVQVQLIPEETAKKYRAVVFAQNKAGDVVVACSLPNDAQLVPELKKIFPKNKITVTYSLPEDIDALFVHYKKPLETRFSKIIEKKERVAPELLEEIFEDARIYRASDIHFEPQRAHILVRFRIDGVLREAGKIPKEFYDNILNRIKVKSGLRIDAHFAAQDGSLRYEKDGVFTDMRTSILPTVEGEKVVLRVLGAYVQGLSLSDLGLSAADQQKLIAVTQKPFGMMLVIGPTGSGKTTTLYGLLKLLNNSSVNITTIEDPVEYKVETVNQIQVNPATDLTFAKGLRSIVRQDPDIILVGEIRDTETAEIAVNASLTGHLLLSTFHANDAATAIPRLLEMGIEPFLLASTLQIMVAQRLVRKVCDHCRYSVEMTEKDFASPQLQSIRPYFAGTTVTLYQGKGCDVCGQSGYKGRTAIFECIMMSPALQDLVLHSPSSREIWKLAQQEGARSLFEDGVDKVKNGVTTLAELMRIAEPVIAVTLAPLVALQSKKIRVPRKAKKAPPVEPDAPNPTPEQ
jgi:type IV pilus assembly protein PilB